MDISSVHIWTILLDVMAGIVVMFWMWHISNASDYLIHLAMVNRLLNFSAIQQLFSRRNSLDCAHFATFLNK